MYCTLEELYNRISFVFFTSKWSAMILNFLVVPFHISFRIWCVSTLIGSCCEKSFPASVEEGTRNEWGVDLMWFRLNFFPPPGQILTLFWNYYYILTYNVWNVHLFPYCFIIFYFKHQSIPDISLSAEHQFTKISLEIRCVCCFHWM